MRAGSINVAITANFEKFARGTKAAARALGTFNSAISKTIFSMKGLAVAAGGALAATAFTKLTINAFRTVDAMGELSDKLGVGTDRIAGLQLAAEEAGVASGTLERAMVTLNKNGLGGEAGLRAWITDAGKLATQQERLAFATKTFGSRGADMVRMVEGGTAALDEAQKASEGFGMALSRSSVTSVQRAMDAFGRLKKFVGGVFANLAVELSYVIDPLISKLNNALSGKAQSIGRTVADAIIGMTKFVANGIQRMVEGVLHAIADVKVAIFSIRTSLLGGQMGLGFADNTDRLNAQLSALGSISAAAGFSKQAKWGDRIQQKVDRGRLLAAQPQKDLTANPRGLQNIFAQLGGGKLAGLFSGQQVQAAGQRANAAMGAAMRLMPMLMGMGPIARTAAHHLGTPSGISAQDPLSREGFAQRVRSLGQNNLAKIGQQQLAELRKTRMGVDKLANPNNGMQLVAMNLLGQ